MRRAVIDLGSLRPLWSVLRASVTAISRAFGSGWTVRSVRTPASSDGDGGSGSPAAIRAARGAEVYVGWGVSRDVIAAAGSSLRWVHSAAARVGSTLTPEFAASGVRFTNSKGVHAEPMADWAVAAIAFCARGFHWAVAAQRARRWDKASFTDGTVPLRELADLRVGIVGLGGIGRAVARRGAALGMQVSGVRRRPHARRPAGVAWVAGPNGLRALARRSDVLVIAAPHTAATRSVVDAAVLRALPKGAYVVNLARGALLDEKALCSQLQEGRLGGCVLDVFAAEPLPASHPFWRHPRVLVTPHVSAATNRFWEREETLIVDNVRRYLGGRRLRNLVDFDAGYEDARCRMESTRPQS